MTDNIKEEMKHYRSLAIKVEETLKSRQLVKRSIKDKCIQADVIETNKLKSIKYDSDSDLSNRDTTSDTNNSDSHSRTTIIEPMMQVIGETRDKHNIQPATSDAQHSQLQVCLTDNIDTKPATVETDQNEYSNATETPALNDDISSEGWKPKVPNTLNIVPITLSNEEDNINSPTVASKEDKSPPKLSRQGSYILDAPSPMLLAHMHTETELVDKNYVPTPTHTNNVPQRKQWNIMQPKIKWENKQLVAEDNKASNKLECTTSESTIEHTEFNTLAESYQVDQFVNNTKTEVTEEHVCKLTSTKHNDISDASLEKQNSLEKLEKDSGTCVSNLSNEKSVENANSLKSQSSCIDENKHRDKMEDTKEHQNLIIKTKSSITPEKLLTVYKEIEEMHKKQMMELIYRQQKEQSLLQAEFQKQQMLLLAEIQKCSSNIPYQVNASSNVISNQLSINKERLGNITSETEQQLNVNPANNSRVEAHYSSKSSPRKHTNVIVCPLDYISSKNLYLFKHCKPPSFITDTSPATPDFDFTKEVNLYDTTCNNNNNDDNDDNCELYNRPVYKNLNVNRQLFPLNSNTTHVPIIDTSVYLDKHVSIYNFNCYN